MKTMKMIPVSASVAGLTAAVMAALILGACAPMNSTQPSSNPNAARYGTAYPTYGVVRSIEVVQQASPASSGVGLGTVAGAVIGGVLGHQVGAGRGNTVATVAGAAGGAYVGHQLESKPQAAVEVYRIHVRMDDGSSQTLTQESNTGLRVGDRVRFENGSMQRY